MYSCRLKTEGAMGSGGLRELRAPVLQPQELSSAHSRSERRQEPQLHGEARLADTLTSARAEKPGMLCWTSILQNCEPINKCCVKLLNCVTYYSE